ncbi:battenin isoform X1 [Catharus ustulatus]|uniref:battenin isoform X1 n=1 Tax=Catharus ustulatus TaxID=91951 RepID=UPI001408CE7D|nr:battenin isoform X1 [Catharus ustulatus]
MADEEPLLPPAEDAAPPPPPPTPSWRIGAAFWILGLCNNLPYVVMLSAARDLLDPRPGEEPRNRTRHDCNPVGTGAVLLADVVPGLGVKLLMPLLGPYLPYRYRAVGVALCLWGGVSAVASASGSLSSLGGVALGSVGAGLGEVTFLTLAASYSSTGLSHWSAGTGAAGLGGALGFWGLRALLPLPQSLLPLLVLPPLMLASFFFLLGPAPPPPPLPPSPGMGGASEDSGGGAKTRGRGQEQTGSVAKAALQQGAPLAIVYFAEYFVNQGLMELLYFPSSPLPHSAQYRTLQLLYQAGVFVSRSSLRCLRLRRIWGLALAQALLALFLLAAVAVNHLLPWLGLAAALAAGEGLLGGGAYGNAFGNVGEQVPLPQQPLAVAVVTLMAEVAIAAAGGVGLGAHAAFCGQE